MSSAAVRRYWTKLVEGGCCICGGPAEIAHCTGGSITALDLDREAWESVFGDQAAWIDNMKSRTGIDAWAQARALQKTTPPRKEYA
jgi:hypothetical protein